MSDTVRERLASALADRYRIERELGRGGMSTVFLAEDLKHHRRVAIKVLDPEVAAAIGPERFLREIETVARLTHPHILPVHDSGVAEGFLFYVMPYVDGESLRDRLTREKQLPLEDALRIAREVADALDYAHRHRVVHRDIKPENILLEEQHALLADFGIARAVAAAGEEKLTATGIAVGTPAYMSPEQTAGGRVLDGRSDLYSLGCVLYEMLAGQPPFTGPTLESLAHQHLNLSPRPVTQLRTAVPPSLEHALAKSLAKTPADRFATTAEFAHVLEVAGTATTTQPRASLTESISPASGARGKSIAVLPFANMSPDPDNEYFADGMTEEVINVLTKIRDLRVTSRTSTSAFKGKNMDVRKIGEQLNVDSLLEGSVRRAGNKIRVTAQLIDVASGYHLWSERYDRDMVEVFEIQDEIARAIVERLKVELTGEGSAPLVRSQTDDMEAYSLYVKGRYLWNQRGEGLSSGLVCFQQAVARDPNYGLAHVGMADCYSLLGWYCLLPPKETFPLAIAAAEQALRIDESLAEAHISRALVATFFEWDWLLAEREFARGMDLNPGYPTGHHWFAEYLLAMGRTDEALREARRAQELDPLGLIIFALLGGTFYYSRQYDQAIRECERAIEMGSTSIAAHHWLGLGYLQKGMLEQAVCVFERGIQIPTGRPLLLGLLGHARALSGRTAQAERDFAEISDVGSKGYSPLGAALVQLGLGAKDAALDWLEKAHEERAPMLMYLAVDPIFDGLRTESRFRRLVQRMALS
jgi:serine/threonine-protein kinase